MLASIPSKGLDVGADGGADGSTKASTVFPSRLTHHMYRLHASSEGRPVLAKICSAAGHMGLEYTGPETQPDFSI